MPQTLARTRSAVAYARISSDKTGLALGVTRQDEDVEAVLARTPDLRAVCDTVIDNDMSAADARRKRPGFEQVMAMIEAGEVEVVIAASWDRITRNRRETLRFIEATKEHRIIVKLVTGMELDMGTTTGRLIADTLAMSATFEVDMKADRQHRANTQHAEMGKATKGRRPFGYESDGVTIRESEAELLRKAYAAILAGSSAGGVATMMNKAGARTSVGGEFSTANVKSILINPRYIGIRSHTPWASRDATPAPGESRTQMRARMTTQYKAQWPAIIDEDTYRAAVSILNDPARRINHHGGEKRNLLTGVGECPCGDTVRAGSRGAGHPTYRCSNGHGGGHVERVMAPVDDFVQRTVLARLSRADAKDLLIDTKAPHHDALTDERRVLRHRMEQAGVDYAEGLINGGQVAEVNKRCAARLAEIDAALAHRDNTRALAPVVNAADPFAAWEDMSLAQRQAVLTALGRWIVHRARLGGSKASRYRQLADYRVEWIPAEGITE